MKKIILFLIVSIITISITHAQNIIKQIEIDNQITEKNPVFTAVSKTLPSGFSSVQYTNLGEKGILRKEGLKYQLFDLNLNLNWEATLVQHDIKYSYFGIGYFKIAASNEFIYIFENYVNSYGKTTKTFITQFDFSGKIVLQKSYDDIIPYGFSVIDFFASDKGCHYVSTNFYRREWIKEKTKKDSFGTFSKDGLEHVSKELSLPYNSDEKILISYSGSDVAVVESSNFYYTDAEIDRSYYGDNISSRLTKYYNTLDNSFYCQSVLINKEGVITNSLIVDQSKIGNVEGEVWGGTILYSEKQKLFYNFLPISKKGGTNSFKAIIMDEEGNIIKRDETLYQKFSEAISQTCSTCKFEPRIDKYGNSFTRIFYDNFNDCIVVQIDNYGFELNKELEITSVYQYKYEGFLGNYYSGPLCSAGNTFFSQVHDLKPSENYLVFTDVSDLKSNPTKNKSKNALDFASQNIDPKQKSYNVSNTILTLGEFQYVFIDNTTTKKTKLVKLGS